MASKRPTYVTTPPDYHIPSVADIRDLTLKAAGYNEEEVGKFIRLATDKLIEKLGATTTQFFANKGKVLDQREVEDNASQIRAASELAQIGIDVMALRRRTTSENPPTPPVNLDFSGWTVQMPTPPPKVVEVVDDELSD